MTVESVDSVQVPPPIQVKLAESLLAYSAGNNFTNTWPAYRAARPDLAKKDWVIPVTLTCDQFGHCYDIEPGGGQNKNIGIFMHNAKKVWKTQNTWGLQWLYTFASNLDDMIDAAHSFGYEMGRDYYVLCAHPNTPHGKHICSRSVCGYPKRRLTIKGGTQYLFAGAYDRSILPEYMLPHAAPKPVPTLHGKLEFHGELDADHGKWSIHPLPGQNVQLGGHDRKWAAKVTVTEQHGVWDIHGLPFE